MNEHDQKLDPHALDRARLEDDIRHLKGARRVLNCVALAVSLIAGGALAAEVVVFQQSREPAPQVRCSEGAGNQQAVVAVDDDTQALRRRGKRRLVVVLGGATLIGLGLLLFAGSRPPKQTENTDSPENDSEDEEA